MSLESSSFSFDPLSLTEQIPYIRRNNALRALEQQETADGRKWETNFPVYETIIVSTKKVDDGSDVGAIERVVRIVLSARPVLQTGEEFTIDQQSLRHSNLEAALISQIAKTKAEIDEIRETTVGLVNDLTVEISYRTKEHVPTSLDSIETLGAVIDSVKIPFEPNNKNLEDL